MPADLAALTAAVRTAYGIDGVVTPMGGGHDSAATVYRFEPGYVLKVRDGGVYEPGLVVPTLLSTTEFVVPPEPALDGRLWASLDGDGLVLYPYVDGRAGKSPGLSPAQWRRFGAMARYVHGRDTSSLAGVVPVEPYQPRWGGGDRTWAEARALTRRLPSATSLGREVAEVLLELTDRAEELAGRLREATLPPVLCHADMHTGNVLVDTDDRLWLLDWDEVVLAPRERDLMFAVGGGISRALVSAADTVAFLQGYGEVRPDPLALSYYRHTWAVQDLADYGEQVFERTDLSAEYRAESEERLRGLFGPGEIIDLARTSALD